MFKGIREWWRKEKVKFAEMVAEKTSERFTNKIFTWISYDKLKEILEDQKIKERGYVDYGYLCDLLVSNTRKK